MTCASVATTRGWNANGLRLGQVTGDKALDFNPIRRMPRTRSNSSAMKNNAVVGTCAPSAVVSLPGPVGHGGVSCRIATRSDNDTALRCLSPAPPPRGMMMKLPPSPRSRDGSSIGRHADVLKLLREKRPDQTGNTRIQLSVYLMSGEELAKVTVKLRWNVMKLWGEVSREVASSRPGARLGNLMFNGEILLSGGEKNIISMLGLVDGDALMAVFCEAFTEQDLDNIIRATQDSIGSLISRPKMFEKYLRKPPVRFLHDIVTEVMRKTGFLEGLLSPDELDARSLVDKAHKVDFLNKVIHATSEALGEVTDASANTIVAGLDAARTNLWLHQLHRAAVLHQVGQSDSDESANV